MKPVPTNGAPSDDQGGRNNASERFEAQQKETEDNTANTDKENQMPDMQLQSQEQDGAKVSGGRKKKGEGKVKRSSNRQVSQLYAFPSNKI